MRTYAKMLGVADSDLSAMDDVFELETLMAKVRNIWSDFINLDSPNKTAFNYRIWNPGPNRALKQTSTR